MRKKSIQKQHTERAKADEQPKFQEIFAPQALYERLHSRVLVDVVVVQSRSSFLVRSLLVLLAKNAILAKMFSKLRGKACFATIVDNFPRFH